MSVEGRAQILGLEVQKIVTVDGIYLDKVIQEIYFN